MTTVQRLTRHQIALRAARDLQSGWYVNLGIGIPNMISESVAHRDDISLHSENGVLGLGPQPEPENASPDLIDSGKRFATLRAGGAFFDSATSFAMIRGGHIDASVVGAYQVSATGDLANWSVPGDRVPGIGGAADICAGIPNIFVTTTHNFRDGSPKLVTECTYPVTGVGVVTRIFTDLAVIDCTDEGFILRETVEGASPGYVQDLTGAPLVWDDSLGTINVA